MPSLQHHGSASQTKFTKERGKRMRHASCCSCRTISHALNCSCVAFSVWWCCCLFVLLLSTRKETKRKTSGNQTEDKRKSEHPPMTMCLGVRQLRASGQRHQQKHQRHEPCTQDLKFKKEEVGDGEKREEVELRTQQQRYQLRQFSKKEKRRGGGQGAIVF